MAQKILDYGLPTRIQPLWEVPWLSFRGGQRQTRTHSLTGTGVIPSRQYLGNFTPTIVQYKTRYQSLTGPGDIAARPGFLTPLFGGNTSGV